MRKIGMNLAAMIVNSENEMPAVIEKMTECGFNATFTGMFEMEKQMEIANLLSKHGIEYETLHAPSAGINNM